MLRVVRQAAIALLIITEKLVSVRDARCCLWCYDHYSEESMYYYDYEQGSWASHSLSGLDPQNGQNSHFITFCKSHLAPIWWESVAKRPRPEDVPLCLYCSIDLMMECLISARQLYVCHTNRLFVQREQSRNIIETGSSPEDHHLVCACFVVWKSGVYRTVLFNMGPYFW
jgi:hypothetical protein